jgi:hypothetical protein
VDEAKMDDTEYKNLLLTEISAINEINDKIQEYANKHKLPEDLERLLLELDFILNGP